MGITDFVVGLMDMKLTERGLEEGKGLQRDTSSCSGGGGHRFS